MSRFKDNVLTSLFMLSFALMIAHELDAVANHEWRVLPLTSFLPDNLGFIFFVTLHIPLIWALLRYGFGANPTLTRDLFCGFCVVHVGLHWLFRHHPAYEFDSIMSKTLIGLTGICGLIYLGFRFLQRP
jgi:hypothetical protein